MRSHQALSRHLASLGPRFRLPILLCFLIAAHTILAAVVDRDDGFNLSGGISWATVTDAEELERDSELREQKLSFVDEGIGAENGGFSSLDSMLQWAIGNSDPERLKAAAQEVQKLAPNELENRRAEVKELMERLRTPSDAELMKIAIADLQNSSLSVEYRQRALQELLELVEPIDNANDLSKLDGLIVVVQELDRAEEELRTSAAWILGKASQNNRVVQDQILELGVLPRLMQMVQSSCAEEAVKALYAVSAVIRNHPSGQEAFYLQGGALLLQDIMRNASADMRLRRKSVFLVADLAEQQLEIGAALVKYQPSRSFLKSVVDLTTAPDLDTQEKMQALMAIRSLGQLNSATYKVLRDYCEVKAALEKVRLQLEDLLQDEDQADFASDMEALRQLVASMFSEGQDGRTHSS